MSGGSYDYAYRRVQELASDIREIGGCGEYAASPALRRAFIAHLQKVTEACRAIEWNDSGDGDRDEVAKIRACLEPTAEIGQALVDARAAADALLDAVVRAEGAPDELAGAGPDPGFGVDPGDSAALLKLRQCIDDHLEFPTPESEEAGDYESAVRHTVHQIAAARHVQRNLAQRAASRNNERRGIAGAFRDAAGLLEGALSRPGDHVAAPVVKEQGLSGG
jgi:hypothetical protein